MKWTILALLTAVLGLVTLGMVMLYSCSMGQVKGDFFIRQVLWLAIGLGAGGLVAIFDYRMLNTKHAALALFALAVALLLLVLVPGLGAKINGARRWLFGIQPSEFGKVTLILFLAHYASVRLNQMGNRNQGFLIPMAWISLVSGLIFCEPDWGTAVLVAAVGAAMLAFAGTSLVYLLAAAMIGAELFVIALCHDQGRMARVLSFLDPERFKDTVGWQPWNAVMALGSGKWTGVGLGHGRLKLGFIPEHHTDFILAVIGEELGLLGAGSAVVAFAIIVTCGLRIAWRASDAFGQLAATGITCLIGFQAFINLGVATSSLPNKGLPLPFVSYGGSNLVAMLTCVGFLISIARRIRVREKVSVRPPAGRNIVTANQALIHSAGRP